MKRPAVLFSLGALLTAAVLVSWWKLGGFYTVRVIDVFNLQSRLSPA